MPSALHNLGEIFLHTVNMNTSEHFFEHTHQPLCVVHFDGRIAAANSAMAQLVGKTRDELTRS